MRSALVTIMSLLFSTGYAQKIEEIHFNLYTDSLKKGVYNYINVDGKDSDGKYSPLTSNELNFSSTAGRWDGNSLVLDTASKIDSVVITACLKSNPSLKKKIVIYLKKKEENAALPTEDELLNKWKKKKN